MPVSIAYFPQPILALYPSSFKLQRCYLHLLTPVTYSSKRLGMSKLVV
ncbi:Uncharacterised protein [Serratia quinivorans]|nr:Uncharacterised protein [Serratia quinivorans]